MMSNQWLNVSLLTFKEGLRNRVLYGVIIFALLVMFTSTLVSGFFLRDISKIILDFCLSAISLGGLLVPLFLAVSLLSRDIERRTVYTILSRPISRSQYILGKFGGLVLLTLTVIAILTLAACLAVWLSHTLYAGRYFRSFSWTALFLSAFMSFLALVVLNAVVVLWCTLTTSSFLATLLTLFTYVIGHTMETVVRFIAVGTQDIQFSPIFKKAMTVAMYLFPNLSAFDIKLQAAHGVLPPANEIVFLLLYALAYVTAVLLLAMFVFQRRDLV